MAQADIHCPYCKEVFCLNCHKIHRMKELSRNHKTILLSEMDGKLLQSICQKILKPDEQTTRKPSFRRFGMLAMLSSKNDQKTKYIDKLAVEHDHETEDFDDEIFCPDHLDIFCKTCSTEHVNCPNICGLERAASQIRINGDMLDLISKYKKCHAFLMLMIEDRKRETSNLLHTKEVLLQEMAHIRSDYENTRERLQDGLEEKVEENVKESLGTVKSQGEKCEKMRKIIEKAIEELVISGKEHTKQRFVKTHYKLKAKYQSYENQLKRIYDEIREYKFKFYMNSFIPLLPESLVVYTSNQRLVDQRRLPPFLEVQSTKPLDEKAPKRSSNIKLWGLGIFARAGITSLKCTSTSQLVTVNRTECEVRVFHASGWTYATYSLSSLPWDLALVSDKDFVVSLPGEHKVLFFKMNENLDAKISLEKEIDITEECWGIESIEDNYIGTFEPWTSRACVKIFDLDGKIKVTTKQNNAGENIFRAPQHVICDKTDRKIYISDAGLNAILTLNPDGQILASFSDPQMIHPTGMTIDYQGNLYVCGKNSKNIIRIPFTSGNGASNILAQNDVISNPRAMCFYTDGETLLVACSGKAQLYRFKLT
ncbi:hypothetical protein FSP39_011771 [Pinctada imbricata]|uniref:B box-type domain-containing protein n=1 Tax=Pinctada imbricata TaxID=66713 RepID=A0AA89BUK5_PINIB|nr:hypothetical protein FSP39_011771 [Pinctada imbricata]